MNMMRLFFLTLCFVCFAATHSHAALQVQTAQTAQGADIWLIEDKSSEVVAVRFSFPVGASHEDDGKEGLAYLLSDMLIEGAGELSGTDFQKALEDDSIGLSFSAGRDEFYGQLNFVKTYRDKALKLTNLALTQPAFFDDAMRRIKDRQTAAIKQQQARPEWQMWRNFNANFFKGHVYSRPAQGTEETIEAITADDLRDFIKDGFCQRGTKMVIVGDMALDDAVHLAENLLQNMPTSCAIASIAPVSYSDKKQDIEIELEIPQAFLLLGWQGIRRDDADWYAAQIANYILGGGGFSSRLMDRLRVQEGLTYGISSSFSHFQHADIFFIRMSTEAKNKDRAMALIYEEIEKIMQDGIDEKTLNDAKTFLINSYVTGMTSSGAIAGLYHSILLDGFTPEYLNERRQAFQAVTAQDIQSVLMRVFRPQDENQDIRADLSIFVKSN